MHPACLFRGRACTVHAFREKSVKKTSIHAAYFVAAIRAFIATCDVDGSLLKISQLRP